MPASVASLALVPAIVLSTGSAWRARRFAWLREVRVRVMAGAAGLRARRMAMSAATTAAPMLTASTGFTARAALGMPSWILVRSVFAGFTALRARRVRAFLDLELRRRRELHAALQQLLDVPEVGDFVR